MEEKKMMQIGRNDLIAARQALNQISVKGIKNCQLIYYIDQLLESAVPVKAEETEESK